MLELCLLTNSHKKCLQGCSAPSLISCFPLPKTLHSRRAQSSGCQGINSCWLSPSLGWRPTSVCQVHPGKGILGSMECFLLTYKILNPKGLEVCALPTYQTDSWKLHIYLVLAQCLAFNLYWKFSFFLLITTWATALFYLLFLCDPFRIKSLKEMCNCLGRRMVLQCPECIFHFPAGIQHPEISQIQGRSYPEESEDGYCCFVIRADRSRLSRVLVKKRIWVEGITLCYLCERQSLHTENFNIAVPRISAFKQRKQLCCGKSWAKYCSQVCVPQHCHTEGTTANQREPSAVQDSFLVVPFFCLPPFSL